MIGLRIGAAELAEIEAGAPAVILAPGQLLPHALPLVPLLLRNGVLARPGADTSRSLPLPTWVRPLALVAPEAAAAQLLPLLPAGLPVVPDVAALLGRMAGALREATAARDAAAAERDRLKRALGTLAPPLPHRVLELAPAAEADGAELPLTQPLGRSAEGLCTVELHVAGSAAAGPATTGLRARLLAGDRVLGAWCVPPGALSPGWLALDLPEPAPAAAGEASLELAADPPGEAPLRLSPSADRPRASLALRLWTAPPGWSVLPLHFAWSAAGATLPALPLALPAALLAGAVAEGARVDLVGAGAEPPCLLLELPPGGEAVLRLPPAPVGGADLLRARLQRHGAGTGPLHAALTIEGAAGAAVGSGWREMEATGQLGFALPLPPGPMAAATFALRYAGEAAVILEVAGLALQAGAAGEPRRPPPAEPATPGRAGTTAPGRIAVALPGAVPLQPGGWRTPVPAPRAGASGPSGTQGTTAAPVPASAPAYAAVAAPPGATGYQELRLHQHMVNADGSYRHLDIGVAGLVSGGGLWRQIRLKLFDRRGTVGLEFREMAGWPQMFDAWPGGRSDNYGPFWRLETEAAAEALGALVTPHDRALIAALLDVLPELAARAAGTAGLPGAEAEAWAGRARALAGAAAPARGARPPG